MNTEKVAQVELVLEALEPWLLQLMRFSLNDTAVAEQRTKTAERLVKVIEALEGEG